MEYLTLHQLSRQFNKPERQVRYKFRELMKEGKLAEGDDFRKDDFVDEFHFAYKINPLRFMEEAKLDLDQQVVTNIVSKTEDVGSQSTSKEEGFDTNEDDDDKSVGSREEDDSYQSNSQDPELVSNPANHSPDIDTKFGTERERAAENNLSLDYIETLKEQMRVKDSQIESYKEQLDGQSDVTRRAITELLKMKDQVLRLRGAEREDEERQQPWNMPGAQPSEAEPARDEGSVQDNSQTTP